MKIRRASSGERLTTLAAIVLTAGSWCLASPAQAMGAPAGACSMNAGAGRASCRSEIAADFWATVGVCLFETGLAEIPACLADAFDGGEARAECQDVYEARMEVCQELPGAYDPSFDPADFDDDFGALTSPNPYWPLGIGNVWRYGTDEEEVRVEVLDQTKDIEGVTCITVLDQGMEDGVLVESTNDWEAMGKDGSVHYCGEISQNFELFEGDDPPLPELVDVEGSWKTGRDGAKPGVLMPAVPEPGPLYRQEWSFGVAEDMARVLSNAWSYGNGEGLDDHVPQALADHFCADEDCVVTEEFTPIEPGVFERKYYARGIGLFLEVELEDGGIVPLVECNFHPLCEGIPEVAGQD